MTGSMAKITARQARNSRLRAPSLFSYVVFVSTAALIVVLVTSYSKKGSTPEDDYVHKAANERPLSRKERLGLQSITKTAPKSQERKPAEVPPHPPADRQDREAQEQPKESLTEREDRELSEELRQQPPDRQEQPVDPAQIEDSKTKPAERDDERDPSKLKIEITEGFSDAPECARGERAIDDQGNPCIDLRRGLKASSLYYVNEPDTQYVMCAIPKNGCSYHLALLGRITGEEKYEDMSVIHDKTRKVRLRIDAGDRDSSQIAGLLVNDSLPKYIVVRNPLRRTLSGYLDKVWRYQEGENRTAEAFHRWLYEQFPEGTNLHPEGKGLNPHWRPQTTFCGFNQRDVHEYFSIFRVEEPAEYVDFLYSFVADKFLKDGWRKPQSLSFRDHVLAPRKRTTNTGTKFHDFFNNLKVFDHMASVLREDIDRLGYKDEVEKMREALVKKLNGDTDTSIDAKDRMYL